MNINIDDEPFWVRREFMGNVEYEGVIYGFRIKNGNFYPTPDDYEEMALEWDYKRNLIPKYLKNREAIIIAKFRETHARNLGEEA